MGEKTPEELLIQIALKVHIRTSADVFRDQQLSDCLETPGVFRLSDTSTCNELAPTTAALSSGNGGLAVTLTVPRYMSIIQGNMSEPLDPDDLVNMSRGDFIPGLEVQNISKDIYVCLRTDATENSNWRPIAMEQVRFFQIEHPDEPWPPSPVAPPGWQCNPPHFETNRYLLPLRWMSETCRLSVSATSTTMSDRFISSANLKSFAWMSAFAVLMGLLS